MSAPRPAATRGLPLGGLLLVALLAYTAVIHHGVGPAPTGGATHWFQPRGFLVDWMSSSALGQWIDGPGQGLVAFGLPALVLALAVWASTRSALARTLAGASVLATLLFLFYGLGGSRTLIWAFFGWRGSGVMALTALVLASALHAPLLAASWLRRGWPARLALGLPVLALVVLAQRDVTGTDPRLPFAISPWPVVPVFAIEIGAVLVAAVLAVLGLVAAAVALRRARAPLALACLAAAAAGVAFAVATRARPGSTLLWVTLALGALALGALSAAAGPEPGAAVSRARGLAAGAVLVALPILAGLLVTERDYGVTRDDRAQRIIDALRRYYQREQVYPDSLQDLVAGKDLDAIPRPSIGFGLLANGDEAFTYQNFGTSYLLEFSAPRWVQCAYNPPYADEDAGPEGAARSEDAGSPGDAHAAPAPGADAGDAAAADGGDEDADAAGSHGAWSCPSKPPELW